MFNLYISSTYPVIQLFTLKLIHSHLRNALERSQASDSNRLTSTICSGLRNREGALAYVLKDDNDMVWFDRVGDMNAATNDVDFAAFVKPCVGKQIKY